MHICLLFTGITKSCSTCVRRLAVWEASTYLLHQKIFPPQSTEQPWLSPADPSSNILVEVTVSEQDAYVSILLLKLVAVPTTFYMQNTLDSF